MVGLLCNFCGTISYVLFTVTALVLPLICPGLHSMMRHKQSFPPSRNAYFLCLFPFPFFFPSSLIIAARPIAALRGMYASRMRCV